MTERSPSRDAFFVGYLNAVPKPLAVFLFAASLFILGAMAAFALTTRLSMNDPGDGRFMGRTGNTPIVGRVELHPYPVLRMPPGDDGTPARTLMLSGQGKRGVVERGTALNGQMAEARGAYIKRGDLTMLQVGGVGDRLRLTATDAAAYTPADPIPLGRWRITGEICDGKCYVGAMRPGRGLAHKACANFCIHGGVPAVFVSTAPVDGGTFFLLADKDGKPFGEALSRWVALSIEAEGEVERLDDLLVFKMDPETVRVLR